jgi:hypothetical protein
MINSMTTPNGQLFDTTIMDEHSCQFVNGFTGEVFEEMPWQELNAWGDEKPEDVPMPTQI